MLLIIRGGINKEKSIITITIKKEIRRNTDLGKKTTRLKQIES